MKFLNIILFFNLFVSVLLFAKTWMSEADIDSFRNKSGTPISSYPEEGKCETGESESCYDTTGKNLHYHTVQDVTVDDEDDPQYGPKVGIESCSGVSDCQTKLAAKDCSGYGVNYHKFIDALYTEVYCTEFLGYGTKIVQQLNEDAALKAAYLAEEAQKDLDNTEKNNIESDINDYLVNTCIAKIRNDTINAIERDQCIVEVIRLVKIVELALDDLKD